MPDATGLQTKFQNPTSGTLTYPFLGEHGVTLAAGATFTHDGGPFDQIRLGIAGAIDRKAMKNALIAGRLAIVATPSKIVEDTVTGNVKAVVNTTAAAALANPSWGAFSAITPHVLSSVPANLAVAIAANATVAVVFNTAVTGGTITLAHGVTNNPGTTVASGANSIYTFTPTTALTGGVAYVATVSGFVDALSNAVPTITIAFTVAPQVLSHAPTTSQTGVSTATTVVTTFNESVTGGTVVVTKDSDSSVIAGTLVGSVGNTVWTMTPGSALEAATQYDIVVSGYHDAAALNLASSLSFHFTTA